MNTLDLIEFEPSGIYVMDKAYIDFYRLHEIELEDAYFVICAKNNLNFRRIYSKKIRRVKYWDEENKLLLVFLTNNFELDAIVICMLYKMRWQIELFFKWIKQHLRIKAFWGYSPNAVKTQIWIAVCTYLLVALLKKQLKSNLSLYEITQIISVSAFDKTPLNELLTINSKNANQNIFSNQLNLFDL